MHFFFLIKFYNKSKVEQVEDKEDFMSILAKGSRILCSTDFHLVNEQC